MRDGRLRNLHVARGALRDVDPAAEAVRWFDEGASAYAARNPGPSEHVDGFLALLPPRARVLDLGCGPGTDARALADAGHRVVAVDAAPAMIDLARSRHPDLDLRVADMRSLELPPASYDGVLALFSLIFVPRAEQPALLARIHDALVPGGVLLVAVQGGTPADVGEGAIFAVTTRDGVEGALRASGFLVERTFERDPRGHEMPYRKIHVFARRRADDAQR